MFVLQQYGISKWWVLQSLLSQNYQDEWDEDDHLEVANEDIEVLPMSGINTESKNKGRSKNFSEEEDNLLVSTWLNV
jgi:hypothetical protein